MKLNYKSITKIWKFTNILKLNNRLINNQWAERKITKGIRKYLEMNENQDTRHRNPEVKLRSA